MKKIQALVVSFWRKLRCIEPISRKFITAIRHVFAAENSEGEHLFRRQIRLEIGMKIPSLWLGKEVFISLLHSVLDNDFLSHTPVVSRIPKKKSPRLLEGLKLYIFKFMNRSNLNAILGVAEERSKLYFIVQRRVPEATTRLASTSEASRGGRRSASNFNDSSRNDPRQRQ